MPDLLHANDRQGEYPASWYADSCEIPPVRQSLQGDQRFDVGIVGGGLTGLSAAYHLAERGYSVAVLEAHRVGWGASGRNGGQANSGQRVDQDALETQYGRELAHHFWAVAEEAKDLVRNLITRLEIDCHLTEAIVHADHRARFAGETRAYAEKLQSEYGYDQIRYLEPEELREHVISPAYHAGTLDTGAFHLHPLAFTIGLARAAEAAGAVVFENAEVKSVETGKRCALKTENGTLNCDYLLFAANGYLGNLEPRIARRVLPINNFVIATRPLTEQERASTLPGKAAVGDSKFVINYFRMSHDNRLIFGGGENYGYRFPDNIRAFVRKPMSAIFPRLKDIEITHGWGGTLAITMKRQPLFKRLEPNVLNCSGYSGHGVTIATLAGKIAAEAISGQSERFDLMAKMETPVFPGGTLLRYPLLVLAMSWFALRDRL